MGAFNRIFRPKYHDELVAISKEPNFTEAEEKIFSVITNSTNPPARGLSNLIKSYKQIPRFRSVVHLISSAVASVPWQVGFFKQGNSKKTVAVKQPAFFNDTDKETRDKIVKQAKEEGEFQEVKNHPLIELLDGGNAMMTGHDVRRLTETYLELPGESFWQFAMGPRNLPEAIYPVQPNLISDTPKPDKPYWSVNYGPRVIPMDEMMWFRELDPADPYGRGSGIGFSLADELDTAEYMAQLQKAAYYNRGLPSAMVGIEGANKDSIKRIQESWSGRYQGARNFGKVHFTNGKVSVETLTQKLSDLDFTEGRQELGKLFQQVYGVPPELLGVIESSNRATIEQALYIMAKMVLKPRLERLRMMWQKFLVPLYDDRLVIDYVDPTPENTERQFEAMKDQPHNFSENEWRAVAGKEPWEGGDSRRWAPLNLIEREASPIIEVKSGASMPVTSKKPCACCEPNQPKALPEKKTLYDTLKKNPYIEPEYLKSIKDWAKARPEPTFNIIKATDAEKIENVLEALRPERISDPMEPIWQLQIEKWGQKTLDGLGVGMSFNMLNPLVQEHIFTELGDRIKDLVDPNTKDALRATLFEGVKAGEGIRELRERVHDVFLEGELGIWNVRANRIARTEIVRSSNFAIHTAHVQSTVVEKRQWVAALINSRPEHESLNGQIRGINERFSIGGESAMYPGNFPSAYMNVNCMCTIVALISEPKSIEELEIIQKQFVQEIIPWENQAIPAIGGGLENQMNDVIAELFVQFG